MKRIDNKRTYESSSAVEHFAHLEGLQPPEQAALDLIGEELRCAKMLDIGVGGGRTTPHFAPWVRSYTAVDYSAAMIAATRARFSEWSGHLSSADVRHLPFRPASFDFVLFSYNGLDYIGHDERLLALREIRGIVREGGLFLFSTHNVASLAALLSTRVTADFRQMVRRWRLRRVNPPARELTTRPWVVVRDGAMRDRLLTYYVSFDEQRAQLEAAGFGITASFGLGGEPASDQSTDVWIYFLCRAM